MASCTRAGVMGVSATPSLIARPIASMHHTFIQIFPMLQHLHIQRTHSQYSSMHWAVHWPYELFLCYRSFKISHKKGISFIDSYTDIQNQLLNRTEFGKWPVPSLVPRLSIPELVSQLWRKLGRKVWEDFTMPPCCHWKLWGYCVSSKTLSHLGLASSWLPTHVLIMTSILWHHCGRYDMVLGPATFFIPFLCGQKNVAGPETRYDITVAPYHMQNLPRHFIWGLKSISVLKNLGCICIQG